MAGTGAGSLDWQRFGDADGWVQGAADWVRGGLAAIYGPAGLLVPGGSTPAPVLAALAGDLDWSHLHVTLTDERWVCESHRASNAAMVRRTLQPPAGHLLPLYREGVDAAGGVPACQADLAAFPLASSLCLLGMGADGHVASLFPRAPQLAAGLVPDGRTLCLAVPADDCVGGEPEDRLSLTLAALLRCRAIGLLVKGAAKAAVIDTALAGADPHDLPVAAVLRQDRVPVTVLWAPD